LSERKRERGWECGRKEGRENEEVGRTGRGRERKVERG